TMTVPMIRESTAAAAARRRVAQKPWRSSPEFSKSGVRSNIAHLFHGVPRESGHAGASPGGTCPHGDAPARRIGTADLPRPGRTGPSRGIGPADQAGRPCQAQPSISGTVLTSLSPVPAKCFSRYWPTVPREYILVMALLTASLVSVSPFFMPTPYFSSVKGSLMTLKEPGCWLANPARMRSSVLTASSAPDFSLL